MGGIPGLTPMPVDIDSMSAVASALPSASLSPSLSQRRCWCAIIEVPEGHVGVQHSVGVGVRRSNSSRATHHRASQGLGSGRGNPTPEYTMPTLRAKATDRPADG
ncbi:hypothetical protein C9J85_00850 [Haloferax sp. wsp5]|nr:hypothetical protein C9J85_00850 [Haloferax sp. wsp5]